jgi:hypothetical protein
MEGGATDLRQLGVVHPALIGEAIPFQLKEGIEGRKVGTEGRIGKTTGR